MAERAETDRTWAYGHLVVDEAQELSPMMWRLLMRRCPSRSLTLVGDVAQVGLGGRHLVLVGGPRPLRGRPVATEELTVNYRTPAQVMRIASAMLAAAGIAAPTPESVRDGDRSPAARRVRPGSLAGARASTRCARELAGSAAAGWPSSRRPAATRRCGRP